MGVYIYGLEGKTAASKRKIEGFPKPKGSTVADFQFLGKILYDGFGMSNEDKIVKKGINRFKRSWSSEAPDYIVAGHFLCKVEKEVWNKLVDEGYNFINYDLELNRCLFSPGSVFRIIGLVTTVAPEHKNYKLIYSGYLENVKEAKEVFNTLYKEHREKTGLSL